LSQAADRPDPLQYGVEATEESRLPIVFSRPLARIAGSEQVVHMRTLQ
jgi:hypothetical protein